MSSTVAQATNQRQAQRKMKNPTISPMNIAIFLSYLFSKSHFYRPTSVNSSFYDSWVHSKLSSPFGNNLSFASITYRAASSCVLHLLSASSPETVLRFVVSITISSLNTCVFLTKFFYVKFVRFVHIISKILKLHPSFTYLNTSSSVNTKLCRIWIEASSLHARPRHVKPIVKIGGFGFRSHFMTKAQGGFCGTLFTNTTTALRMPIINSAQSCLNFISAVTSKEPVRLKVVAHSNEFNRSKSTEFLTRYIRSWKFLTFIPRCSPLVPWFISFFKWHIFTRKGHTLDRMWPSLVSSS